MRRKRKQGKCLNRKYFSFWLKYKFRTVESGNGIPALNMTLVMGMQELARLEVCVL